MARQLTSTSAALLVLGLLAIAPAASSAQRRKLPPAPAAAPKPRVERIERPVPFHVGETLTYDVSWSSYVSAGTAVVAVKEKKPSFDSTACYIVAEARTAPLLSKLYTLYYKMDTLLDAYTLLPQRLPTAKRQETPLQDDTLRPRPAEGTSNTSREHRQGGTLPCRLHAGRRRPHVLRSIPPAPAITRRCRERRRHDLPVGHYVGAAERIRTPIGEMSAWKVAGADRRRGQSVCESGLSD